MTPLDRAFAAAEAPGAAPDARVRFYGLLLETTLFLPVAPTADDSPIAPLTFALDDGPVALAFDDDARMAAFFEGPTDYVALPGRALIAALRDAPAPLGLGLNLGDAPSATLLDAETVRWLAAEMGGDAARADLAGPLRAAPPAGATPGLMAALAERLREFPGLVQEARLVRLGPPEGPGRLTLLVLPAPAAARAADGLAAALGRAAAPHAPTGETVEIGLLSPGHALLAAAQRQGADLLSPPPAAAAAPVPPTPPRPPILR